VAKTIQATVSVDSFDEAMKLVAEWKAEGFVPDAPLGDGCKILRQHDDAGLPIDGNTIWLSNNSEWRRIHFPNGPLPDSPSDYFA